MRDKEKQKQQRLSAVMQRSPGDGRNIVRFTIELFIRSLFRYYNLFFGEIYKGTSRS